jgi:hypothetical protein
LKKPLSFIFDCCKLCTFLFTKGGSDWLDQISQRTPKGCQALKKAATDFWRQKFVKII